MIAHLKEFFGARWELVQSLARRGVLARYLAARLLVLLRLSSRFLIRQNGFQLRFYPSAMSLALWVDPDDRLGDERFFARYLRPGETVVDVGANIGNLTLAAAREVGAAGRVIAIEPHPTTFRFLRGNLALNGSAVVEAHNVALGAEEGEAHLTSHRADDMNAVGDSGGVVVPLRSLDAIVPPGLPVALLKIDVEGYELRVLEGALRTLQQTGCVYFESHEPTFSRFGYSGTRVIALLREAGFTVMRIGAGETLIPVDDSYTSGVVENLVAHREPDELRRRIDAR